MAWKYNTFTWPTDPTWTTNSTYGYELTIATGISGLTSDDKPVLDPLIPTVTAKPTIEEAWSHILAAETLSTAGSIKFYSNSNSLTGLNGVTIQVSGY